MAIKELKINALLKPRIMYKVIEKSERIESLPISFSTKTELQTHHPLAL